ncbi:unnamed protein product [Prunus armeniaca]|uniref:Uncharacterized protein n=1 Tax=Prunus armeniaca TaxID=36596 RepID=A0A6J5UVU0_PRUAR|nr:unnamed protein product [Prunus armeniaca]
MRPKPPPFDFFSPIPHRPKTSDDGSESLWWNFWWREGLGVVGIELWVWGKSLGDEEVRWEERRVHMEGEKLTVTMILGGGVGG